MKKQQEFLSKKITWSSFNCRGVHINQYLWKAWLFSFLLYDNTYLCTFQTASHKPDRNHSCSLPFETCKKIAEWQLMISLYAQIFNETSFK